MLVSGLAPSPFNNITLAITASVMLNPLKYALCLVAAGAVAFVVSGCLLPSVGGVVNLVFAITAAYLTIVVGRRVLGRKQL